MVEGAPAVRARRGHGGTQPPPTDGPLCRSRRRRPRWHDASATWEPDWSGDAAAGGAQGANYIAFSVRGGGSSNGKSSTAGAPAAAAAAAAGPEAVEAVYVGFNPNPEGVQVALPAPPAGMQWRRLIDTSRWAWGLVGALQ
jgi:hypothetical protein